MESLDYLVEFPGGIRGFFFSRFGFDVFVISFTRLLCQLFVFGASFSFSLLFIPIPWLLAV